jgi:hypothetical protein
MGDLRYGLLQRLVAREHFNAGRGDISQMGVAQSNRKVGRPTNGTGSECMIFSNKRKEHVRKMGSAPDTRENSRGARRAGA